MSPITTTVSILSECQSMLEVFVGAAKVNCFGTNQGGKKCGNWIAKTTMTEIKSLLSKLIKIFNNAGDGYSNLLERLSCLVMCRRQHQPQAVSKCGAWNALLLADGEFHGEGGDALGKGDSSTSEKSLIQRKLESNNPTTPQSSPKAAGRKKAQSNSSPHFVDSSTSQKSLIQRKLESNNPSTPRSSPKAAGRNKAQSHSSPDFDDSGYFSGGKEDPTTRQSRAVDDIGEHISTGLNDDKLPQTPQRRPRHVTHDSGFSEPSEYKIIKIEESPGSPSVARAQRIQQNLGINTRLQSSKSPQQTGISVLSKSVGSGPKVHTPREFKSSAKFSRSRTSQELREMLIRPLRGKAEEGHIYSFQIDGYQYTKIGYTTRAVSFRADEHKQCGWWNPFVLVHQRVDHVERVERIVQRHLDANRFCEYEMSEGSNGRTCHHQKHIEWFDIGFTKMYIVIKAWSCWMGSIPYVKNGNASYLSSVWTARLETLSYTACHEEWIQWLSHCLPDTMEWVNGCSLVGLKIEKKAMRETRAIVFANAEINEDDYEPFENLWRGYAVGSYHKALGRVGTW